jgi:hypothetical protein
MLSCMTDAVDDRDKWSILHFSVSNPEGPGQGDVAALLRRAAVSIELLGDIQVMDLTFKSEVTGAEDDLTITAYYERSPRRR